MALRSSDVNEFLIEDLLEKLAKGLREGGRTSRWLLYAAAIKSITRGHRPSQLPASLGVLAALVGLDTIWLDTIWGLDTTFHVTLFVQSTKHGSVDDSLCMVRVSE
jgi:hypothetical protein